MLTAIVSGTGAARSAQPVHGVGTFVVDVHGGAHRIDRHGRTGATWLPRGHRLCMYTEAGPAIFTASGRLVRRFNGSCLFSPDSRWTLVFEHGWLTAVRVSDGTKRRLVRGEHRADWSADGRTLYYVRERRDELWSVGVDDRRRRRVLAAVGTFYGLSPSGRRVLYNPPGRPGDYWVARVDGNGARFLFRVGPSAYRVDWAPEDRGVFSLHLFGGRLAVHRLSGERRRPGFRVHGYAPQFAWSPDGAHVAWTREQVGERYRFSDVRVGRPDGTRRRTLARFTAPNTAELYNLSWSADGKRLLVTAVEHDGD